MNNILPRAFEKCFINKNRKHLYNTRGNSLDVWQVKTTCNLYVEFLAEQTQHSYIAP